MQISMIQILKGKQFVFASPNVWAPIPFVFDYLVCILFRWYHFFRYLKYIESGQNECTVMTAHNISRLAKSFIFIWLTNCSKLWEFSHTQKIYHSDRILNVYVLPVIRPTSSKEPVSAKSWTIKDGWIDSYEGQDGV